MDKLSKAIQVLEDQINYSVRNMDEVSVELDFESADVILELLKEQPKIVRCKECKYAEHWYADKSLCFLWSEIGIGVFKDGYCNYGKLKDGEQCGS